MLLLLGILLIFVGFVFAVARRGLLLGTSSEGDSLAGHAATTDARTRAEMSYFTGSGIDRDKLTRRRKVVEVLIGLGLMVLGIVCIVAGT